MERPDGGHKLTSGTFIPADDVKEGKSGEFRKQAKPSTVFFL